MQVVNTFTEDWVGKLAKVMSMNHFRFGPLVQDSRTGLSAGQPCMRVLLGPISVHGEWFQGGEAIRIVYRQHLLEATMALMGVPKERGGTEWHKDLRA